MLARGEGRPLLASLSRCSRLAGSRWVPPVESHGTLNATATAVARRCVWHSTRQMERAEADEAPNGTGEKAASGLAGNASIGGGKGAKSTPLSSSLIAKAGSKRPRSEESSPSSSKVASVRDTPLVEKEYVRHVYDSIASHWHGTRYKAWPKVQAFIENKPRGTFFGDIGCGNGKNMPACNQAGGMVVGSDTSAALLSIASERGYETSVADIVNLPFRTNAFDCVLCIAVLHHISTAERRLEAIRECMRVVRVGGDALFYAWAMEQRLSNTEGAIIESRTDAGKGNDKQGVSGHRFAEPDVLVPWHLKRKQAKGEHPSEEEMVTRAQEERRAFVAEHASFDKVKNAFIFQRYCHVYKSGELENLVKALEPQVVVERIYFDTGNWAMILRKVEQF